MGEYVEADGHKARAKYLLRRAGNSRNEPPEVAPIRHLITAVTNKDREVGVIPEFRGFGGKLWRLEVRG